MDNVKLVAGDLVESERAVLRGAKRQNDGMTLANWLAQLEQKKSGGIRRGVGGGEIAGGNHDTADGLLFSRVRILHQDGATKGNCFLPFPADYRENAAGKDESDQHSDRSFDFVGPSHAHNHR